MSDHIELMKAQTIRRVELKSRIKELEGKIEPLEKELFRLSIDAHNQQADVDNLEGFSIKNWYLNVTGKKEALMDKERREAQAARVKHDTAKRELDWIQEQLSASRQELKELSGCAQEYWSALETAGDQAGMVAQLENVIQELGAAVDTTNTVMGHVENILNNVMNLLERNRYGSGNINMMMPSYLASEQKRINLLGRELAFLVEEVSDLPIEEPILEPDAVLVDVDEHLLDELTSAVGRDTALGQAKMSLGSTRKALGQVQAALDEAVAQKEKLLEKLKMTL